VATLFFARRLGDTPPVRDQLWMAIFETAEDAIAIGDLEGNFLAANQAFADHIGYPRERLATMSARDVMPPELGAEVAVRVAEVRRAGRARFETTQLRSDGSRAPVEVSLRLVEHEGRPAIVAVIRDISAREKVAAELHASENTWRALVDASTEAVYLIDREGTILASNEALARRLGSPLEELVGQNLWRLLPPGVAPERRAQVEHVIASGRPLRFDEERGGRIIDRTISPVRDAGGAVARVAILGVDVTERRQIEVELRSHRDRLEELVAERTRELARAEERLRHVVSSSPVVIFGFTPVQPHRGTFMSDSIRTLLGWEPQQFMEDPTFFFSITHPEDMQQVLAALPRLFEVGRTVNEYRMRARDGSYRWIHDEVQLVRGADGAPVEALGYWIDVSARKAAEEELRLAKQAADEANRAKSEFLSRMSHELRTPLNAILGFAQLLEMDELTLAQRLQVEDILAGGRHLLELINEVLDIARIESGALRLSVEPVRLIDVVVEVIDLMFWIAAGRGVRVEHSVGGTAAECVMADRQRLKQVLLNLLSNAIKYSAAGAIVAIESAERPRDLVRLLVRDTGPGIAPEKLHRLFSPFDRLGAEQTPVEGTGLGLALSKRLVEAMAGTIGVTSTVGAGSTFWVELPRAPAEQGRRISEEVASVGAAQRAAGAGKVVLYVEDNLSNLKLIQAALARRPDVRVLSAIQGQLGLDLARSHRPDLILLDLHLPDLSGAEVLRRLQADAATRGIPVVVISADALPKLAEELVGAGARAFVTKPIEVQRFLELAGEILDAPARAKGKA
jgi:PAS domain S-box-containing protein